VQTLGAKVSNMSDAELRSAAPPRPLQTKLADSLYAPLLAVYMQGRRAVVTERDRQLSGQPVAPIRMQEGDTVDVQPTAKEQNWVRFLAGKFAGTMVGLMGIEAVRAAANARNADQTGSDERRAIEDAVRALSVPRQQAMLTGTVTQAFTNGRNEQAASMSDEISSAFYSAIMDQNTCDVCAPLDGAEHDPNDDTYDTPNPDCLGGENCRCVTVYVFRDAKDAQAA